MTAVPVVYNMSPVRVVRSTAVGNQVVQVPLVMPLPLAPLVPASMPATPSSSPPVFEAKHEFGRRLLTEAFGIGPDWENNFQVKNTFIHVQVPWSSSVSNVAQPARASAPAIVQERSFHTIQVDQAEIERAHNEGRCKPCAYFYYKQDGCRMGSQCQFCHLCTRGEIRRRKKERTRALRQTATGSDGTRAPGIAAFVQSVSDHVRFGQELDGPHHCRIQEVRHKVQEHWQEATDGAQRIVKQVSRDMAVWGLRSSPHSKSKAETSALSHSSVSSEAEST